jgi:nucleolar protein 9
MLDSHELDDQPEERGLFIRNVLSELKHDEYRVCCDMLCSRVLEKLFEVASPQHVHRFSCGLLESVAPLAQHRYGSHVLQSIVAKVGVSLRLNGPAQDEEVDEEAEPLPTASLSETFLRMCDSLLAQFPSLVSDTYGAHVIAAVVLALSGCHVLLSVSL